MEVDIFAVNLAVKLYDYSLYRSIERNFLWLNTEVYIKSVYFAYCDYRQLQKTHVSYVCRKSGFALGHMTEQFKQDFVLECYGISTVKQHIHV